MLSSADESIHGVAADESIHGVAVEIPTNHREIPGSTPGRYNLQIEIASFKTCPSDKYIICQKRHTQETHRERAF